NVTRGRGVPRERLMEVAEHYHHFGGVSPINGQVRDLIAALRPELDQHGVTLPIYWGNRNWHPLLPDTMRAMADARVENALPPARWRLVYQSRSGRPTDPWLGPDILDHLRALPSDGASSVVVHPVGFLSDHMEILYDLDDEARRAAESLGLPMARAATVGTH